MNISTVNELIASLESAGELSIREQKFLKLAKAYQQLAAENLALKNPDNWLSLSEYGDKAAEVASGNGASEDEALRIGLIAIINRIATPATDRIVAGFKADGVEEWVSSRGGRWNGTTEEALKFAKQLREGKSEEVKS